MFKDLTTMRISGISFCSMHEYMDKVLNYYALTIQITVLPIHL